MYAYTRPILGSTRFRETPPTLKKSLLRSFYRRAITRNRTRSVTKRYPSTTRICYRLRGYAGFCSTGPTRCVTCTGRRNKSPATNATNTGNPGKPGKRKTSEEKGKKKEKKEKKRAPQWEGQETIRLFHVIFDDSPEGVARLDRHLTGMTRPQVDDSGVGGSYNKSIFADYEEQFNNSDFEPENALIGHEHVGEHVFDPSGVLHTSMDARSQYKLREEWNKIRALLTRCHKNYCRRYLPHHYLYVDPE